MSRAGIAVRQDCIEMHAHTQGTIGTQVIAMSGRAARRIAQKGTTHLDRQGCASWRAAWAVYPARCRLQLKHGTASHWLPASLHPNLAVQQVDEQGGAGQTHKVCHLWEENKDESRGANGLRCGRYIGGGSPLASHSIRASPAAHQQCRPATVQPTQCPTQARPNEPGRPVPSCPLHCS